MDLTNDYFVHIAQNEQFYTRNGWKEIGNIYCTVLIIANHIHWQANSLASMSWAAALWMAPVITFKYLLVVFCIWPSLHEVTNRIYPQLPPQSPGLCTRHLWEHGVLRGIRRGQAKSIHVKQTLVTLVFLRVKKPTVVLPQLRVQLPEAAITSIPLYRPNLSHTGNVTGADRKTGKTTPSPRTATPSDGFLRPSPPPKKTKRTGYRLVVAPQSLFSTFVLLFTVHQKQKMSAAGASSNPRRGQLPIRWEAAHATLTTASRCSALVHLDVGKKSLVVR